MARPEIRRERVCALSAGHVEDSLRLAAGGDDETLAGAEWRMSWTRGMCASPGSCVGRACRASPRPSEGGGGRRGARSSPRFAGPRWPRWVATPCLASEAETSSAAATQQVIPAGVRGVEKVRGPGLEDRLQGAARSSAAASRNPGRARGTGQRSGRRPDGRRRGGTSAPSGSRSSPRPARPSHAAAASRRAARAPLRDNRLGSERLHEQGVPPLHQDRAVVELDGEEVARVDRPARLRQFAQVVPDLARARRAGRSRCLRASPGRSHP